MAHTKKNTCSIVGVDQCVRCICGKRYSAVFEGIRCHVRVHFARLFLFDVCTKILCFRRTVKIKANKKSRWNKLKTYTFYREMKSNTHYTEHIEGTAFMSFLLSCNLSLCINQSKENTAARQMPDYHFCFRSYFFFVFVLVILFRSMNNILRYRPNEQNITNLPFYSLRIVDADVYLLILCSCLRNMF